MNNAQTSARKLSLSTKIIYGIGTAPASIKNFAFSYLLLFYYNQVLGVSGTLCGLALGIAMCFDAISDPMVGSASDNFRSKLGRRHPFMYAAAVPLGLTLYLLFVPPDGFTEFKRFIWMVGFAILVRLSITFYEVPYSSLQAEFTQDYFERTKIASFRMIFGWLSNVFVFLLTFRFIFPTTPEYTPGHLNPAGYPVFAMFAGAIVIITCFFSTHFTRNQIPFLPKPLQEKKSFSLMNVYREVMKALQNRNFRIIFIVVFLWGALFGTYGALMIYMYTYFWGLSTEQISLIMPFAGFGTLLGFALVNPIQKHFEKRTLCISSFCLAVLLYVILVNLRFLGILPENGDPLLLKIIIAERFIDMIILTIWGAVSASIMADVIDEQEFKTNLRQEGIFFSAISFSMKAVSGVGVFLGGMIIDLLAFPVGADPITLDPLKIRNLGIVVGIVLPLVMLIPIMLMLLYDLNKTKLDTIHAELAQRRAQHVAVETEAT